MERFSDFGLGYAMTFGRNYALRIDVPYPDQGVFWVLLQGAVVSAEKPKRVWVQKHLKINEQLGRICVRDTVYKQLPDDFELANPLAHYGAQYAYRYTDVRMIGILDKGCPSGITLYKDGFIIPDIRMIGLTVPFL